MTNNSATPAATWADALDSAAQHADMAARQVGDLLAAKLDTQDAADLAAALDALANAAAICADVATTWRAGR